MQASHGSCGFPWWAHGAAVLSLLLAVLAGALASPTVPTEIEQPGTQPGEVGVFDTNCDNCHFSTSTDADLQHLPSRGWHGSMMAHSMRDPLFWATLAIAEQDFLPHADPDQRGGAGDLCLRCHGPNAWLAGRSTPTDGSSFVGDDERGVECELCHLMLDPDPAVTIPGTVEAQTAPYEAFEAETGEAYYGSGQYVLNSEGTRLGPYDDASANHAWLPSPFLRRGEFCGTCHDVSNPAVGDLAHNNGAQVPLDPSSYSGVPGSPVVGKAAFNNPPYRYGVVERTFSEWKASGLAELLVNDYAELPDDLKVPGGALDVAFHRAFDANSDADYVDGTLRYFTCQTCHMAAVSGQGCNKQNKPVRDDLPRHDLTGGGYWMPDVITYQADSGTLRFGTLDQLQRDALAEGKQRAQDMLQSAASLQAGRLGEDLLVRVTNLTGHKLISGYPEGRRMWLNVKWFDGVGTLIEEDGRYGSIGRSVNDLDGTPHDVQSLIDIDEDDTAVYQAEPGMDQQWASQLIGLGYDADLALAYDRVTDGPTHTLGELAAEPEGTVYHSFHFVLNNVMIHDNRIPPFGFDHDEARKRNALPVPDSLYGDPGAGGVYEYWDEVSMEIPDGAVTAEVRLYYQQTSWEYIQFLWLENDQQNAFLGQEGVHLLDAWLNTGMSPPLEMAMTPVAFGVPGEASRGDLPSDQLRASYDAATEQVLLDYVPGCDAGDHTIYYGDLAQVSTYVYSGAECSVGVSGLAGFDPGPGDVFFVIVAENGLTEGSYGRDSDGFERPEDEETPDCDRPQDPGGVVCE